MSVTAPKTARLKRTASPSTATLTAEPARTPLRVLAVVDSTEATNHVVDFIASLAAHGSAIETVVLNVQSKRGDHRLRGYQAFKRHEIDDRLINDLGMPIVSGVTRRFDKLGIAAQGRVEIGEPVEVIPRCADEEHCDVVVIGEAPPNLLRRFLARALGVAFGSAASLAAVAERPVVLATPASSRSRPAAMRRR